MFPEGTAEPKMVQLRGGEVSAITEAIRPYCSTHPLLMQPAIAEATHYNRETLPQGVARGSRVETTAEPAGTGRITQQQGGASAAKQWLVCLLAGQDTSSDIEK